MPGVARQMGDARQSKSQYALKEVRLMVLGFQEVTHRKPAHDGPDMQAEFT